MFCIYIIIICVSLISAAADKCVSQGIAVSSGNINISVIKDDFPIISWTPISADKSIKYIIYRATSPFLMPNLWRRIATVSGNKKNSIKDFFYKENKTNYYYIEVADDKNNILGRSNISGITISGYQPTIISIPTAYRQATYTRGLNVDFLLTYYVGRLYGTDEISARPMFVDYRIGLWLFTGDFKVVLESEKDFIFNLACGYRYTYLMGDRPLEAAGSSFSFKLGAETGALNSWYIVISKRLLPKTYFHIGYMLGDEDSIYKYFSEYLYKRIKWTSSGSSLFFSLDTTLLPIIRLQVEVIHPTSHPYNPWIIQTNLGRILLGANFKLSFIQYKTGHDLVGIFCFPFTLYPAYKK